MSEPEPSVSEMDQLDAATRDLLAANGLAAVGRQHMDERWLARHTAEDLVDALLETAVATCAGGGVTALVAFDLPTGVGYQLLSVRRRRAT